MTSWVPPERSRPRIAIDEDARTYSGDHQSAGFIGNQRLLVHTHRGWAPYAYGPITDCYPDLGSWTLTMVFGEALKLLVGQPIPAIALLVRGHDAGTLDA